MESVFGNLLQKAMNGRTIDRDTNEARNWLRNKAQTLRSVNTQAVLTNSKTMDKDGLSPGRMFLFSYDPKHKDILPYYDRFPLIFPIGPAKGGILGINLHYLPPILRAKLMDALYDTLNNNKLDESTKLKISYEILNSSAKFRYFLPCVKHYLNSHIDSRIVYVDPKEWDFALFLPLQRFQKASSATVYSDSRRIISKGR